MRARCVTGVVLAAVAGLLGVAGGAFAATNAKNRLTASLPATVTSGQAVRVSGRLTGRVRTPKKVRIALLDARSKKLAGARLGKRGRFVLRFRAPGAAGALRLRVVATRSGRRLATTKARSVTVRAAPVVPGLPTPAGGGTLPSPAGPPASSGGSPGSVPGAGTAPAPASAPAVAALRDLSSVRAIAPPNEISDDSGVGVIRTQLELDLAPGATAADFQALLDRLGAEVVSSLAGVARPTIRIPDPGSLAALDQLIAQLRGDPVLDGVTRATIPVPETLPPTVEDDPDIASIRPQLATRQGAAWNARGGFTTIPSFLIADYFGDGAPGPAFGVDAIAADYGSDDANEHGYLVLGLAAAAFDPTGVANHDAEVATGAWAGDPLPVRAADLSVPVAGSTLQDRLLLLVKGVGAGPIVVNTSLGDGCAETPVTGCTEAEVTAAALAWIERVRDSGQEDRFLQVSAAGNLRGQAPEAKRAPLNSAVNAAALLPLPGGVANLKNTLVVENGIASIFLPGNPPLEVLCRTESSKIGGDVLAVGRGVHSFGSPTRPAFFDDGGTSSATPQVAGVAASVWALRPTLTPAQVAERIRRSARTLEAPGGDPECNASTAPVHVLDAYAALRSADTPGSNPADLAVLDVAGEPGFAEDDLTAFADEFVAKNGAVDYGRFDLNGDGRTGGPERDRMDLDHEEPLDFAQIERSVLGQPVSYDEESVSDIDALCFAANSPLYTGDATARDDFLGDNCLPRQGVQLTGAGFKVDAFAQSRACPQVAACESVLRQSFEDPKATLFRRGAQASVQRTSDFGTATSQGNADTLSRVTLGSEGLRSSFTCSLSGSASVVRDGAPEPDAPLANGGGGCSAVVTFELDEPATFDLSSEFVDTAEARLAFTLRRVSPDPELVVGKDPGSPLSESGTLEPGTYELSASLRGAVSRKSSTSDGTFDVDGAAIATISP